MRAQPGPTGWPQALRAINWRRRAPQVRVVMSDPAAGSIVYPRDMLARAREVADHRQQGLNALGEIGQLGRPVIHPLVDVDRVLAAPGRSDTIVPDALQIRRLAARARTADQQVAA